MSKQTRLQTLCLSFVLPVVCSQSRAFAQSESESAPNAGSASVSEEESGTSASSQDDEAQREDRATEGIEDDSGRRRLSDRIKAVQRKVFMKKGRVEIFPQFALDLNDPFYQHLIVGGSVAYHIADSFGIEARGGFAFASIKQGALRFVRQETDSLIKNPPEFKYHADIDALWAPIYGKISLFGDSILHFDTYITAGPGVFGTDAGLNPAANVGIGQRYFITEWLTARFEIRDYMFLDSRNTSSDLQNLLVFGFSVSGFFPTAFEYEYQ
ncbi:MAG: outer membrane beta-barrel domain-containing protein [Deltaproteobacteria bacterium]|nr:outer membrane beta-barrel domain-containing protein [Deltaproteobacteria bacterium]